MAKKPPITHWSHSSLIAFLRNPLAWYKRYVEEIYDTPYSPSAVVGRAAHHALEHFYEMALWSDAGKENAKAAGLQFLRNTPDFEINFGKAASRLAKKKRRESMEREYLQAISFYLERPPRHKVLGVEVKGTVSVKGLPLPLKAVADLVVESRVEKGAVDIIDHKFVDAFTAHRSSKSLFFIQALFNYYVVGQLFNKPVRRFVVYECKRSRNADKSSQLRRHIIDYQACGQEFVLFSRLIKDATKEITRKIGRAHV